MNIDNIDYERLRRKLVAESLAEGFLTRGSAMERSVNAYNATPEELLPMARRQGINLEDYLLDESK